jgi:hypothetical protein
MAKVDAKVIATRSPIILITRMALSCLHGAPGFLPGFCIGVERSYPQACRRYVMGITQILFFKALGKSLQAAF